MDDVLDCLVVGAGPAGLTAAIYLGRFRRRFTVIHDGDPRAGWIPVSHNHPGFPDGIPGRDLLARMRTQAELYGARILIGEVGGLTRSEDGTFLVQTGGGELRARNVLLATGVKDKGSELPDIYKAVQKGLIRICPICDAYEVIDQAVGVIGRGDKAAREAMFIRTYTADLKVILLGGEDRISDENRRTLADAGVEVIESSLSRIHLENDRIAALEFSGGVKHRFDSVYSALGTSPRTELARQAGALTATDDRLWVNDHQMTSIPGLYAAGDMVRGLNQISIAQAEAAIAATDIHNRLRERDAA
ncbi:MAG TPA: NAD(P)/FAD-dependent oxidoreductase [Caulobacteraceae bacterium]|jgi:thioredoxin reductase (NADPH)